MPIAAVPRYLQAKDPEFYLSAPPGHRFLLYFPVWGEDGETKLPTWQTKDRVKKYKRRRGELIDDGWTKLENDQFACTIAACKTPQYDEEKPRSRKPKTDAGLQPWARMMKALLERQESAATHIGADALLRLDALAIAPFTTGLGNEHPLENGFAFLNPYGLPYLPGSGVKGVLRQAAHELATGEWGEKHGWSEAGDYSIEVGSGKERRAVRLSMRDILFGRKSTKGDTDHVRGALSFWDVIPQIEGDSLMVEIMTPHQSHYYQQRRDRKTGDSVSPHDSGQPTPISFLTVPPGSAFTFHVACDRVRLNRLARDLLETDDAGRPRWQALLEAAFDHAFAWLGFGAKTSVGYGAMRLPSAEEIESTKQKEKANKLRSPWVDETIARLANENNAKAEDILRGKLLAKVWSELPEGEEKRRALQDIKARWNAAGWWATPQGKAQRQARQVYAQALGEAPACD